VGSSAWLMGMVPGRVSMAMWIPCAVFVPVAALAHRRASARAADRALEMRRENRRAERVQSLAAAQDSPVVSYSSQPRRPSRRQSHPDVATSGGMSAPSTWEEVFDQTA
jgi:hypothetical protein